MYINRFINKLIIAILFSMSIFVFMGERSYASLNFNNINIERGISQSTVEVMFQDHNGYI